MGWSLTINIKNRVYIVCRNILSTKCTHDLFVYRFLCDIRVLKTLANGVAHGSHRSHGFLGPLVLVAWG